MIRFSQFLAEVFKTPRRWNLEYSSRGTVAIARYKFTIDDVLYSVEFEDFNGLVDVAFGVLNSYDQIDYHLTNRHVPFSVLSTVVAAVDDYFTLYPLRSGATIMFQGSGKKGPLYTKMMQPFINKHGLIPVVADKGGYTSFKLIKL